MGTPAAALLIASGCPAGHSPSHRSLDRVWRQAEEAGIPVVFHVGGTGALIDPNYFDNGLPIPPDFHGGEENFRSVDYMAIPFPPMQTIATMIFDGVLERHLFNTDYPHVEGGRRPFERFERSLGGRSEAVRERFYADNFIDLMGSAVNALV